MKSSLFSFSVFAMMVLMMSGQTEGVLGEKGLNKVLINWQQYNLSSSGYFYWLGGKLGDGGQPGGSGLCVSFDYFNAE